MDDEYIPRDTGRMLNTSQRWGAVYERESESEWDHTTY